MRGRFTANLLLIAVGTLPVLGDTVLVVFAHPDDETIIGPLLAQTVAQGYRVHLITITSGQKGTTKHSEIPAGAALGAARELEVQCSARQLGIVAPILLGFEDAELAQPPNLESAARQVATRIDELKPDVVVTWGPDGVTGHPDHRAVSNLTTQILQQHGQTRRRPRKLYYVALPESRFAQLAANDRFRSFRTVNDSFITTEIDVRDGLTNGWEAIRCHKTQWTEEQATDHHRLHEKVLGGRAFLRLALSRVGIPAGKESGLLERLSNQGPNRPRQP
jgi:LmbE family N-acetylglucosaminyl deacetylase